MLQEDGVNLLTIIKGTSKYRRTRRFDYVSNYVPPSISEFNRAFEEVVGYDSFGKVNDWNLRLVLVDISHLKVILKLLRIASGSAMYSTLEDGKIVKGLGGVPNEGPVLLVGYHMLMGLELYSLVEEFLREKNIVVRGTAHPMLFTGERNVSSTEFSLSDWMKVMGAVPVTANNVYKLLSTKSHVLLYPGGAREALHYKMRAPLAPPISYLTNSHELSPVVATYFLRFDHSSGFHVRNLQMLWFVTVMRAQAPDLGSEVSVVVEGEEYKLFWPKQQEFVRMAARFGAKIVPFGAVGEDDIVELVLDYNDLMRIPVVNDYIRDATRNSIKIRDESQGEVGNQQLFIPGLLPKVPGRLYFLFGKPIETKGKEEITEVGEAAPVAELESFFWMLLLAECLMPNCRCFVPGDELDQRWEKQHQ
ncbi:unnamed protein product [Dovyalis caffra]|uniref:Acyltransferase n=1 Tax=Dovyalis caffra TaxID=77055 RepID=A0AAV1RXB5_9ROSI|nr:unnamed protein product [Dovyalis caffra]